MIDFSCPFKRDEEAERACLDPDKFNICGLDRIADQEHLKRALATDAPHTYIASRAGRMEFEGKDGLGFMNAVVLHKKILATQGYNPRNPDILEATKKSPSMTSALEELSLVKTHDRYMACSHGG